MATVLAAMGLTEPVPAIIFGNSIIRFRTNGREAPLRPRLSDSNEEVTMPATASQTTGELEVLRHQARTVREVIRLNLDGLTHQESLIQPQPGGNCLNWVVGHLLSVYEGTLQLLGQEPVMEEGALKRYVRGTPPLRNPTEALEFRDLLAAWNQATERVDAGLAGLSPEVLNRPAPFSPSNDPDETVRSLLTVILFHQAYHAGQAAVLRRLVGKEGAIH